jgi:diguanylate cyclase (GGDEF)-like protein
MGCLDLGGLWGGMKTIHPTDDADDRPVNGLVGHDQQSDLVTSLPDGILSDITHLLVSEGSPEKVLEAVAGALSELVPHDSLILYRAEPPVRMIRPVLVRDPAYHDQISSMGPHPYGVGITGIAAETRVPQLVNDVEKDPRALHIAGTPEGEPESLIAVPLLAREELKGILSLYRIGVDNHFSLQEFKLAIVFSELAALAIDNAEIRTRLETEVVTDHLTALFNHRFFHERLAEEMRRSSRSRFPVGLLIYDIDDFKRVNDTYGHLVGDQVLQGVASISRETCRQEDVICRIGGEEFAVILPGGNLEDSTALGERLREGIAAVSFPAVGQITVSVGVAEGPMHASSPRELMACADLALLEAKVSGKDQVVVYAATSWSGRFAMGLGLEEGPVQEGAPAQGARARLATLTAGSPRSVAQLRVLQSLSARLNRLNDVQKIGEVITTELRALIDYHNCRVFVLGADGETVMPIAFRGELTEYRGETYEALLVKVGEGLTGHVAATGKTWYAPDANADPYAVTIQGTPDLDESLLGVPMLYGDQLIGVIVLSKLGIDQFDQEDIRLLEALAASAAVALENARLFELEHEAAEISGALLALSQALTVARDVNEVLAQATDAIPTMLASGDVSAWIREAESGSFRLIVRQGRSRRDDPRSYDMVVDGETAARFLLSVDHPFILSKDLMAQVPERYRFGEPRDTLVAPMRWEPNGLGAIVVSAPDAVAEFSERDVRLARGIADITSLALGNAARFDELERAYVSTVEALANALEAQDEYTGDHARALAQMTLAVGAELGLEGEGLKILELSALFHDIGKIGVPSEIIRKPGPLTAGERREMNRHHEIGEQILAPVPFLHPIRSIVRACHERWDGKGYPDGLVGQKIPLEARIVFVCDAFHAMTSDRPYRAALPLREAVRRLRLASGTQFDPTVVAAFVRVLEAGRIHTHAGSVAPAPPEERTG